MMDWLIDFDDTLAAGVMTWALEHEFPALVAQHQLPYDEVRFAQLVLAAQEDANNSKDPRAIVAGMFVEMTWPPNLVDRFMADLTANHRPYLFPDAEPFLIRLKQAGHRLYLLSNNPHSLHLVRHLNLAQHFEQCFAPGVLPEGLRKPQAALWDYLQGQIAALEKANTVIVGDDPWSDGLFAQHCGIAHWLIDRRGRLGVLAGQYRFVTSLSQISASH